MPQSATDKTLADRIASDFTYHEPRGDQATRYIRIREEARSLALTFASLCPDGRERSLALTNLEQAVMWANAGIARAE